MSSSNDESFFPVQLFHLRDDLEVVLVVSLERLAAQVVPAVVPPAVSRDGGVRGCASDWVLPLALDEGVQRQRRWRPACGLRLGEKRESSHIVFAFSSLTRGEKESCVKGKFLGRTYVRTGESGVLRARRARTPVFPRKRLLRRRAAGSACWPGGGGMEMSISSPGPADNSGLSNSDNGPPTNTASWSL